MGSALVYRKECVKHFLERLDRALAHARERRDVVMPPIQDVVGATGTTYDVHEIDPESGNWHWVRVRLAPDYRCEACEASEAARDPRGKRM